MDREGVRTLARAAGLDLSDERLGMLEATYAQFEAGFARIRAIDVGDREPPTLMPPGEPPSR